jgi:transposase
MAELRTSPAMQEQVRLLFSQDHTIRRIAKITGLSRNTVRAILRASDDEASAVTEPQGPSIDWEAIFKEQSRGAAIKTLHKEHAPHLTYMVFWHEFRKRQPIRPQVSMRLHHEPGERAYFDFADGIAITDRASGKQVKTQLLVTIMPFSSLTEAEFLMDQKQTSFIPAIERAFTRIGGVTPYIVVDNLKSAVQRAHLYDPDTNRTFIEFANHMGFAVLPARPYKPRDKAAVEAGVGVIQRQFYQEVRNTTFYSLDELNTRLRVFINGLNREPMKDHAGLSRTERFEGERERLKPLPLDRFEVPEWRTAKVHPDCHIQVERRFYSVPYQFVGTIVHVRIRPATIEIFSEEREPLTIHPRLATGSRTLASTLEAHYPEEKAALARFDVQAALRAAERIGPNTHALISDLLSGSQPLKFLRRTQGILRLVQSGQVSHQALEHAAERAKLFGKKQLAFIKDAALYYQAHGARAVASASRPPTRLKTEVFLHHNPTQE